MLQVLQELSTGQTVLSEVPAPALARGSLLIATRRTLISAGTERMLVEFGRAGLLEKARQQPHKVAQVIDKARTDGLLATLDAVRSKLDEPLPLGYCNVGIVAAVGESVSGFQVGDRVVSNGAHAQLVAVPRNLCARIPADVNDDAAVFTLLGSIALQGLRLATPTLGERFVVLGLGLIGLLTVQLLRSSGCRVLGFDPDASKVELACRLGAEDSSSDYSTDPVRLAESFSQGRGVDGVIITAATRSSEPVSLAARMCRQRGRVILVGVAGLELNRDEFYRKELTFQVSCSYGPGRYDPKYELGGHDYPPGFVRWTEQRNFEAVLDMLALGRLTVEPLISHRFGLQSAPAAYDLLASKTEPSLGILLDYPEVDESARARASIDLKSHESAIRTFGASVPDPGVLFIGAGNYSSRILIPAFAATRVRLVAIASRGGLSAAHYGRKFGFMTATTEPQALLTAAEVDIVVIGTRHDSHAEWSVRALQAGKHVFVEKPLAVTASEIDGVAAACAAFPPDKRPLLMVGFNRRFSPHARRMQALLSRMHEPKSIVMTVNAGSIPENHWVHDRIQGGGRVIGELCHFVDLARFLVGFPIRDARIQTVGGDRMRRDDTVSGLLTFADGSWAAIHYLANGHRAVPKERVEVFCAGRVLQLDNFRRLRGFGWPGFERENLWRQDKGQRQCVQAFVAAVERGHASPIPLEELLEVSRVTVALGEAARA